MGFDEGCYGDGVSALLLAETRVGEEAFVYQMVDDVVEA